jgi:hypothetical protein
MASLANQASNKKGLGISCELVCNSKLFRRGGILAGNPEDEYSGEFLLILEAMCIFWQNIEY